MRDWTKEQENKAWELRESGKTNRDIAKILTDFYQEPFTRDSIKKKMYRMSKREEEQEIEYKAQHKINEDGSQYSDMPIRMTKEQEKDPSFLLKAHGYDPSEWTLLQSDSSVWNQHNKQDGTLTLYASKIKAKPKETGFDFDKLIDVLEKRPPAKPIVFNQPIPHEATYLHLPLFDLHFGPSTLEYYENTLRDTTALLEKTYKEVLFIIGQDMLHNDDFRGRTASGREIEKVDMVKAWDEADIFFTTLIEKALEKSPKVSVLYSKGNHDESMSWAFVKGFKKAYSKHAYFDTDFKERKVHMLGTNLIGITHGDKNRKNAAANFSIEFPHLWAKSTTREVYMGHLHRKRTTKQPIEILNDSDGVIVRELGSGTTTDQYHDDNGYTLAHKEFEIFEYTEHKKKHIHYV